jgi:hypothetical protein
MGKPRGLRRTPQLAAQGVGRIDIDGAISVIDASDLAYALETLGAVSADTTVRIEDDRTGAVVGGQTTCRCGCTNP